jgi:hypothetical protein
MRVVEHHIGGFLFFFKILLEKTFFSVNIIVNVSYLFQEVNGFQRDDAVNWMMYLNRLFSFTPETYGLSVYLLDRFLCLVKVSEVYL